MVYLDHAATTPILPEALEAMLPWYGADHVGNPGSTHRSGTAAREAVEHARAQVARMINADPDEIYFTSGGTESNNMALHILEGAPVITTRMEHESVLNAIKSNVVYAKLKGTSIAPRDGLETGKGCAYVVDIEALKDAIDLFSCRTEWLCYGVSVMWVNNELGTVNPIKEIGDLCRKYRVVFHTDAVQAVGHVPIDVREAGVDMLSMSAHKFGGPQGVGALFITDNIIGKLCSIIGNRALIHGGGQEQGMRSGTENVAGIVGMGAAAEQVTQHLSEWQRHWKELSQEFLRMLNDERWGIAGEYRVNGRNSSTSNIISLTIPGVHSESLLLQMGLRGVCISAGSACSAARGEPSHVLTTVMPEEEATCTVRISMGVNTSHDEIKSAALSLCSCVHSIKETG